MRERLVLVLSMEIDSELERPLLLDALKIEVEEGLRGERGSGLSMQRVYC